MTITQADRDAAASGYFAWISGNPVVPGKMRAGKFDHHSMIQAFATHAQAAADQRQAEIVAWLLTASTAQTQSARWSALALAARDIESGTWRTE